MLLQNVKYHSLEGHHLGGLGLSRRRKDEEVRGFFVLGVIGVLVVLRTQGLPEIAQFLVDILLAFWGAYAFLAVLGLSEDIFGERVSNTAYLLSLFALGCAVFYVISLTLLYLATYVIVSLILFLYPPTPCVLSIGGNPIFGVIWCGLVDALAAVLLSATVFSVGLIPALIVPPIIVAKGMSRKYGKQIWQVCAATLAVIIVAIILVIASIFVA